MASLRGSALQLADLLEQRAEELLDCWRGRVTRLLAPRPLSEATLLDHLPELVQQLADALRTEGATAAAWLQGEHGRQRYRAGFSVEAVVQESSILRQCVLEMAAEVPLVPSAEELRRLLDFLDRGIAHAVTEHARQCERHAQEVAQRERVLADVSHALLGAGPDLEGVAAAVVDALSGRVADGAGLMVAGADEGLLRLRAFRHRDQAVESRILTVLADALVDGDALAGGGCTLVEDVLAWWDAHGPGSADGVLRSLPHHHGLIMPLEVHARRVGALMLMRAEEAPRFSAHEQASVQALAARLALAVENGRLFADAHHAVRQRDEFLAVASHELRTPLTTLGLHLGSFERYLAQGDLARVQAGLQKTSNQVQRLTELVEQLLDVSHMSSGHVELQRQEVDLAALAAEIVQRFGPAAEHAGVTLESDAGEAVTGSWDPNRLDQVLTNLLSNALKFGAGRPVMVRVERTAEGARLTVQDQGMGVADVDHARIFDRFERTRSAAGIGGMGIGLWVVRRIVEAHGGRVSLRSEPGQGACFSVDLPAAAPPVESGAGSAARTARPDGEPGP